MTACDIFLLSREGFDQLRTVYPTLGARAAARLLLLTRCAGRLVRAEVSKYLHSDSANYVGTCIKTALQCCCFIGLTFFSAIYALTSL